MKNYLLDNCFSLHQPSPTHISHVQRTWVVHVKTYTTKESNMHDWQMTSFLLQCKPNTVPEKGGASAHEYLAECIHEACLAADGRELCQCAYNFSSTYEWSASCSQTLEKRHWRRFPPWAFQLLRFVFLQRFEAYLFAGKMKTFFFYILAQRLFYMYPINSVKVWCGEHVQKLLNSKYSDAKGYR